MEQHVTAAPQLALNGLCGLPIDRLGVAGRTSRITNWHNSDLDPICGKPINCAANGDRRAKSR
jgi:hypothetical protein